MTFFFEISAVILAFAGSFLLRLNCKNTDNGKKARRAYFLGMAMLSVGSLIGVLFWDANYSTFMVVAETVLLFPILFKGNAS